MARRSALAGASLAILAVLLAGCTNASASLSQARSRAGASTGAGPDAVPSGLLCFRRYGPNESGSVLVVSDTHGGHERRLTKPSDTGADSNCSVSPDGTRVVFTRHIGDNMSGEWMRLFTTSTSGGRLKQVTSGRAGNEGVLSKPRFDSLGTFSPDGKQIAYAQEDGTFDGEQLQHLTIDVMKPDGSGSRAVTKLKDYSGGVTGIGWSPDGTRLVYGFERRDNGGSALFVVSTDGTGTRRLTDWTLGAGGTPAWSPKGDVIVFRAVEDEDSGIGNLYAIRPDGSGLTRITDFRNEVISHIVSFSPDGRWIASSSGPAHGTTDMFIARPDGSRMRVVARTPKTSESGPTWAPRG